MSRLTSLAILEGEWRMEREIVHALGPSDRFEGVSSFRRSGPRLVQDETGTLMPGRGGPPMKASRRYVWSEGEGRIDLAFEDMRPFHSLPIGVETYATTYLCPPDRYEVSYDFGNFPIWTTVWRVEGPRKDYRMTTRFQRV